MAGTLQTGIRQRQSLDALCEAAHEVDYSAYESDARGEIDFSRYFVCPTATPLYYTEIYESLSDRQKLRYNQLCGLAFNELVALFESEFADRVLKAIAETAQRGGDDQMLACVQQFLREEEHHTRAWRRLGELSDPCRYASEAYPVTRPSPVGIRLLNYIAARPLRFPANLWVMLALEEKALDVARRCLHMPLEDLDPVYRRMYARHAHDEARHVQIDWHFIDTYYTTASPGRRQRTAWLVAKLLRDVFLRPARSAMRVVTCWLEEFSELRPHRREFQRQLKGLIDCEGYHEMMYSQRGSPILFSLFDRFPEMQRMETVLLSYRADNTAVHSLSHD